MRTITVEEFHTELKAQGVSNQDNCAFICPMCGTIQSIVSLKKAGASQEEAERKIAFSCEGRLTGAGEWPGRDDKSKKAKERRKVRGCNWSLGGLLRIHKLTVTEGEEKHPLFEICGPDIAQIFERQMKGELP